MSQYLPAIFLVDENGEAYHVMRFCSEACRSAYDRSTAGDETKDGTDPDAIEGTQCEQCGKVVA